MISFKNNSFFLRFSAVFFILTIFGYWGIDLNSEELYIALSFFVLVAASFILVRNGVLFFFVSSVNAKYSRMITDLLITKSALTIQIASFTYLEGHVLAISQWALKAFHFISTFVTCNSQLFTQIWLTKFELVRASQRIALAMLVSQSIKARKATAFFGKFFTINL